MAYEIRPPIRGRPPCGIEKPVQLRSLDDGLPVAGKPVLNCATALALATWVRKSVRPAAQKILKSPLARVDVSTSYQCRRRNSARSGKYSEHAFGNGIDILGFRLDDGRHIPVADHAAAPAGWAEFQKAVRKASCKHFTTVLGPGSNAAHASHFHLDLAIRRGGYRLCQ